MALIKKKEEKPKNLKKDRLTVLGVLGITILAIFGVIVYRDGEKYFKKFFQKILEPQTIVSTKVGQLTPKPTPTPKFEKEIEEIKNLTKGLKGSWGVFVQDLATGESYGINQDEVFTAASLIKLPVLLTLFKEAEAGNIDLETKYILKNSDKVGGAGSMQYKPAGTVYTYRQMAELMGKQSDNTAFNVFTKILGKEKIQKVINDLGMKKTSFADNETTPKDIGLFFYKLYKENILIREDRDELLSFLTDTIWEDRIPAGLPAGTKVAHKIGTEVGVISDAGIVFSQKPFILVILSEGVLEKEAKEVLPKIAKLVYEFQTQ
jgi:beta-lactamase class A